MPIFTVGAAGTTTSDSDVVTNSLRFSEDSGDYLQNPASGATVAAERKTLTFSLWVKRGKLGASSSTQYMITGREGTGNYYSALMFNSTDQLRFFHNENGTTRCDLKTNRVFRDPSAWYHIVLAIDTTQGTSSNRVKIYINGTQETSFATETYYTSSFNTYFGMTNGGDGYPTYIGSNASSDHFDGYMAAVVGVGGTQLAPSDFGESDTNTGIWKPKDLSELSYGSGAAGNFLLEFKDSGTLGDDTSGNNNDFTVTNLTSADQSLDNPTNNFCTISPLVTGPRNNGADSSGILTLGNTKCVFNGSGDDFGSTMAVSTGKWYYEVKLITSQNHGSGFVDVDHFTDGDYDASNGGIVNANGFVGSAENSTNSQYILNGTATSSAASYADNDIIGYAFDVDAGEMKVYQNNTLRDTISSIPTGVTYMPIIGDDSSTDASFEVNFGGSSGFTISSGNSDGKYGNFEYAPPSGYYALCTKRLAEFG